MSEREEDKGLATKRADKWRKIFIKIMGDAPWVPIFNEERYTLRSSRMTGPDSLYVDPMNIPVNYDYISVK